MSEIKVGLVMGSSSDWPVMQQAAQILTDFGVPFEAKVVSAHRMPQDMVEYGAQASAAGYYGIIAGAGGAAHLPGMLAALTEVPVFGVPVPSRYLKGEDSLLSIVQMPKGVPVATFAIATMAVHNPELKQKLIEFRAKQTEAARAMSLPAVGESN